MQLSNWHRRQSLEPILAWLFPLTYLIHLTEEYLAGVALATSPSKIHGADLTPAQFLILNGAALLLMTAGMFISRRLNFRTWLMTCLGMVVLVNGLFHVAEGLRIAGYHPGLISGLLIWMPLGIITLIRLKKRVRPDKYWAALATGVIINVIVLAVALGGRRLFER